jgi:hypothetical protein
MTIKPSQNVPKQRVPGAYWLRRILRLFSAPPPRPEGVEGVRILGHRDYVGGLWDEIGALQFEFLVSHGLKPRNYLLDIACGSLRAGVHFISYLESGHYLGIEKEESLLHAGIDNELGNQLYNERQPQFVISKTFDFTKFTVHPHFALAHSLFTHLPAPVILECLTKLHSFIREEGVFFATFNEVSTKVCNPGTPHDHANFQFTRREMEDLAVNSGWRAHYIGDWNHPRHSKMMEFHPT